MSRKQNPRANIETWIIIDWAGNPCHFGNPHKTLFDSFDDAEEYLSETLGDEYETDRQEYEIIQTKGRTA